MKMPGREAGMGQGVNIQGSGEKKARTTEQELSTMGSVYLEGPGLELDIQRAKEINIGSNYWEKRQLSG